jgi:GT2 family glycosyltransferase
VDLVKRLRERGRIAYVHDAVFEHVGGGTFAQWRRPEVVVTRYRSLLRYFAKHGSKRDLFLLRVVVAALAAVRAVPLWPIDRERSRAYAIVLKLALLPLSNPDYRAPRDDSRSSGPAPPR